MLSEDSSVVSSISMGTNRNLSNNNEATMQQSRVERSDVEDGVPVTMESAPPERPLERKSTKDEHSSAPRRPSLKERFMASRQRLSSSIHSLASSSGSLIGERLAPCGQRVSSFCRNNKKWLAIGGVALLLIVIVVTVSVTVTGRDSSETAAPLPERDQALTDIASSVSSPQSLSDPNSPQSKALDWLINEDPLVLTPSIVTTDDRILQRYALAVFYYATDGPNSWLPNSWMNGNECSGQFWIGLSCNDNDEVRSMAFGELVLVWYLSLLL